MPFHFCSDELIAILTLFSMFPGIKFAITRLRRKNLPMKPDTLSREEAEDALDRAGRIDAAAAEERLPVADIVASGAEVGISPDAIREGLSQAKAEREAKAASRENARAWWQRIQMPVLVLVAFLMALLGLMHLGLSEQFDKVEAARVQFYEAVRRQGEVQELSMNWVVFDHDRMEEQQAELLGAENRVSIARRRYDAAVSRYNNWLAPHLNLPARIPYSSEILSGAGR